ncbi:unnamed protein product, partial [Schistosoma curassoni]|uniref:Pecanex-like protein n=1 Tax=Schistosoma curassoni TaxID=6186 RepID=A0A183JLZ0_9TREM
ELNETQNSCETTDSNQSTYQISHVIIPDLVFPNDSLISDEIPCKSEENMLNESSHDRKPDIVVGGSRQKTLDPGFLLLGTRQQGVPVVLRELMLPDGFDLVSPSIRPALIISIRHA